MKPRTFTVQLPGAGSNHRADEAREERIETLKGLLAHAIAEGDSQEFRRLHREAHRVLQRDGPRDQPSG